MILKKNFNPVAVFRYMRTDLLISTLLSGAVHLLYHLAPADTPGLPFAVTGILGSGLAIFIAFRNQSSYGRWWEARTVWGSIVNSSRIFARLVRTFTDAHRGSSGYHPERSEQFKQTSVYLQIAWVKALAFQLRNEPRWKELEPLLSPEDFEVVSNAHNKPNMIQVLMGEHIAEAMKNGTLAGFDSFQMEGQLAALANAQGACERIKNTPLLRQYHFFTRVFLTTFMCAFPLSIARDFTTMGIAWAIMPVAIVVTFVFAVMARVGEVNEDPFDGQITDVPLDAICRTIERDLRETLGETELPAPLRAVKGILN